MMKSTIGPLMRGTYSAALLVAAGSMLSVSGCSKKTVISEPSAPAYQPPAPYFTQSRPISESIQSISGSMERGPELLTKQRLTVMTDRHEAVGPVTLEAQAQGELIPVQYQARGADISDILQVLLGQYLNLDYVLDPKVVGQLTLDIDDEFTRTDLMDLVSGLATMYGWIIEEREGVMFIRAGDRLAKSPLAPILIAAPALESDQPAVRVRRLKYVAPDQMSALLKELITENAKSIVVGRTVVLADTTRQIGRMSRLISALDVPAFEGTEVWTYQLANRRPEEAQKVLEQLATGTAINSGADAALAFVPIVGTQRLMVVAKDGSLQPLVQELLREVDRPIDGERRQRYRYAVQHYPQQALVKLLADFFSDKVEMPGGAGANAPGSDPGQRIRLVSDPLSDVLLIYATPTDYADVLATLRSVDRPPQQVVIQSIIAEVRLANALEYGVEYFLSTRSSLGVLDLTGLVPISNAAQATGGAFFVGGDGFAVIQALDRESSARVLSQPKIVIADRAKGSIQVGGEVPTIRASEGSQTQTDGTSGIRQEIEYRDTGIILDIEPSINESGQVSLKLRQELADALPTDIPNQPEFTTRKIETTVIVPSGKTVLLGGIIIEDKRDSANRVPLIGRVPVLGEAFSNKRDTVQRTELLLAITPTIMNDPNDAVPMLNEFLQSVHAIREALVSNDTELPRGSLQDLQTPDPVNPPVPAEEEAVDAPAVPQEPDS